ncbi:hypothetical protein SAMN04489796_102247 [Winogradskyella thalassocola]|uniref:Uncharacterized protein n=1 Tax=Winogradskyella thalassocola TaxID=262004 RepID=A0A1G8BBA8_9FLAO|nr:hypothetical protein SAMN04489796_102247 [Winogradskyella thalassocola]
MSNQNQPQTKQKWSKMYTAVLIANALYIVLFYFITASFA